MSPFRLYLATALFSAILLVTGCGGGSTQAASAAAPAAKGPSESYIS
ncbi:MAG TPA: hypothetical protein PLD79_03340 [Halothiobacillus sp.]|nr:hypothetical protein [Halothiobacillus sp.]